MAYSFAGVLFGVATPDGMVPRFVRALATTTEHVPYSDEDVIFIGGKQSPTVRCPIIVLAANVDAFEALLGTTAELIYGVITLQAVMTALDNARMNFDQTHYFFDVTFLATT